MDSADVCHKHLQEVSNCKRRAYLSKGTRKYRLPSFIYFFILCLAPLIGSLEITQPPPVQAAGSGGTVTSALPQLTEATFVEAEDTSKVTYSGSGWSTLSCIFCSGGQYRRSDNPGRTATLPFAGTSISIVFVGSGKSGIAEIKIDDVPYPSVNLYNNAAGRYNADPVEYVVATNLTPGQHVLQVDVTGQDGYDHRNGLSTDDVGLDGFRYGNFPFGSVQGRVLDPDGDGLSGVWLSLNSGSQTYSVSAGYDGVFSLSGLPGGVYNITASRSNYSSQTITGVTVTAGSQTGNIDIRLPEAAGHVLFGRIYLPHMNSPAIQQPGTILNINVKEESSAGNWNASLSTAYNTIDLPLVSASFDSLTGWTLQASLPAGTPAELYDLTVSSDRGSDTQVRAVQVVAQFKDPFYFVVLGDPQAATTEPGQATFDQMVDEINLINPTFVLVVGDLIEHGNASEYEAYSEAINRLQVPSYGVPGNHDFTESTGVIPLLPLWKEYLGRHYYNFDYGPYHLIGMDNTLIHIIDPDLVDVGGYFADQVAWAQTDLAAHQSSLLRFLFLHIIRQPGATGAALTEWKPAWLDNLHANMVLYGHAGTDNVDISGETPVHWVETRDMIEQQYRLVRIDNGQVGTFTYAGSPKDSMPLGNLGLGFSPANNGSHQTVTAQVDNDLDEQFEHALLRFVMPRYGCYETDQGTITQSVHSDDGLITVVYVTLDVPANSDPSVTVSQCDGIDLEATATASPNPVIAGRPLSYTLTATNNSASVATAVTLTSTLPAGVAFLSATPAGSCINSALMVTCSLANLLANESAQVTLQVTVAASTTGTLTNVSEVAGSQFDPNPANNTASEETIVNTEADLVLTVSSPSNPVAAGDSLTYAVTITNSGPSHSTGAILTGTLPAGVTFSSATPPGACTQPTPGIVRCDLDHNLASDNKIQFGLQAAVGSSLTGTLSSTLTLAGSEPDPDLLNNTAIVSHQVIPLRKFYLPLISK